jgi:hypothetical protein
MAQALRDQITASGGNVKIMSAALAESFNFELKGDGSVSPVPTVEGRCRMARSR